MKKKKKELTGRVKEKKKRRNRKISKIKPPPRRASASLFMVTSLYRAPPQTRSQWRAASIEIVERALEQEEEKQKPHLHVQDFAGNSHRNKTKQNKKLSLPGRFGTLKPSRKNSIVKQTYAIIRVWERYDTEEEKMLLHRYILTWKKNNNNK